MSSYYSLPCHNCSYENDISQTVCPSCGSIIIEPINVKRALLPIEIKALQERYELAKQELLNRNLQAEINLVESLVVKKGKAVINTTFEFLWKLVFQSNISYQSYKRQVLDQLRQSADFKNDIDRCIIDGFLFGSTVDIIYAALSINEDGLTSYGEVTIVLKVNSVDKRTSALETNSFYFFDDLINRGIYAFGYPFPAGYIAIWHDIHKLVVAKLKNSLKLNDNTDEIEKLILSSHGNRANDVFVELYIYGKIIEHSIEKVIIPFKLKASTDPKISLRVNELSKKVNLKYY